MIGKNTIKRLNSLSLKKYRNKEQLFLVEGDKMVSEMLHSQFSVSELYCTEEFEAQLHQNHAALPKTTRVTHDELKKISRLKTPQNSLALCQMPEQASLPQTLNEPLYLYLDGIQDPGNLGTIVRLCDWFGIHTIFCSGNTVDLYNPKVIQASMGSFMRVKVLECSLSELAQTAKNSGAVIYGAFMEGENVYQSELAPKAILVMGNEGNGIGEATQKFIDRKISIPHFSDSNSQAESLNVSVATAILCSEFKRR